MSGILLSPEDRAKIMQNKNVLRVGEAAITYTLVFKVEAVRANLVVRASPSWV